ncbi:MAG: PAS domain S-box protein, partial [Bacteroidota bacterium]|nr:PAS domain S-box protein [Bacteroidota bacterium]
MKFSKEKLDALFDFYFVVDSSLQLVLRGSHFAHLQAPIKSNDLRNYIRILKPDVAQFDLESIQVQIHTPFLLELSNSTRTSVSGRFQNLDEAGLMLFTGVVQPTSRPSAQMSIETGEVGKYDRFQIQAQQIETLQQQIQQLNEQIQNQPRVDCKTRDLARFALEISDPILRMDASGMVLLQNPAAEKLVNFYFQDKAYDAQNFWVHIAQVIDKSASEWTFESESLYRYFSFTCKYQPDGGYYNIYGKDVTAKKKADKEMERLSLVASANKNGVVFARTDGRITWVNEGFTRMTGYTLEEALGKTPIELCRGPLTDKDTLEKVVESFFARKEFLAKIIFYRKDGSWFWGRTTPQPIKDRDGITTGFFGIIENVTPQKEQEEKIKVLSQIAEDNVNPVIIADRLGLITWVNKSFTRLTGYTLEEAVGKKPGSLLQGPETDPATV